MNTSVAKKHHRKSLLERRLAFRTSLFILPSFIGVATFYIVPFFVVIYYSFIENPISKKFVFFDNYKAIVKNIAFQTGMKNTFLFSLIVVPLAIIIPLLLALALMKKIPLKSTFRTILISPLMVPVASIVLIWEIVFHTNGTANELLVKLGFEAIDWFTSDQSMIVLIFLFLWKNIGYNMILFMSTLAAIPSDMIEAAKLDGAGSIKIFKNVKLPYLYSSIFFVGILSLINSFKVFRETYLLTGEIPYGSLFMIQHYMYSTFTKLNYQRLSTAAIIMALLLVIIIGALFLVDEKLGKDVEE